MYIFVNRNKYYIILFFFLIIFLSPLNKFTLTGDIETDLMCLTDIDIKWKEGVSCTSRIYHNPLNSIIVTFFIYITDAIYYLASIFFKNLLSIKKIFYEFFINFYYFIFFVLNIILLIKLINKKSNILFCTASVITFFFTSYLCNFLNFETFETLLATAFIAKVYLFKNKKKKLTV
jgi:hypothetical protein